MLREEGRRCTETFLKEHLQDLGRRSTFDVDSLLENV
jgi:NTE family protein